MLDGKKTYIGIGLWLVATLVAHFVPDLASQMQVGQALGLGFAGIGAAHKLAKQGGSAAAALLVVALLLPACATTGEQGQRAGQGPVKVGIAGWNAAASGEATARTGNDMTRHATTVLKIPVLDKDGNAVLGADGQIVMVEIRGGLRDVIVGGSVEIDAHQENQVSGTTEGTSQGRTDTPSTETTPSVTVPATGVPGQ